MRIAQLAPLAESVPPKLYGGTERVVAWLTDELVALGHEVTLFASGDSKTSGKLVPVIGRAIRLSKPRPEPFPAYAALLDEIAAAAGGFDVVHSHIDWLHLPLLERMGVPHLTTIHNRIDTPDLPPVVKRFPLAPFVSISDNHRQALPSLNWSGTVYHGMPISSLKPRYEQGRYLAFLGRLTKEKGPDAAIRIAKAAHQPLRMAAKIPRDHTRYYREHLQPLIDGEQIKLVGEVDDKGKGELLASATALLFPIDWPEPFGLVMIEAMACGTPVIGFRRGSVPEIIDDGVTGFVVGNEAEALEALSRVGSLDRRKVRAQFERRFAATRMAQDYLDIYNKLLDAKEPSSLRPISALNGVEGLQPLS